MSGDEQIAFIRATQLYEPKPMSVPKRVLRWPSPWVWCAAAILIGGTLAWVL